MMHKAEWIMEMLFPCSKTTPETSTPEPVSVAPVLPPSSDFSDFTSDLLYPLHSGEQLPLGLLGDDTPSMTLLSSCLHCTLHIVYDTNTVHVRYIYMYMYMYMCMYAANDTYMYNILLTDSFIDMLSKICVLRINL